MAAPVFLALEDVLDAHRLLVKRFGGLPEVRSLELLESALAQPQAGFGDERYHRDLFQQAAAYLYHVVQNHPFVDGNKRVALWCAITFLRVNGVYPRPTFEELESFVWEAAAGVHDKAAIASFLRRHSTGRD